MKKFESLGKNLSKEEKKKIVGGYLIDYCCDVEYTNGSTDTVNVSSDSVQHARGYVIQNYNNVYSVSCEVA